MSDLLKTFSAIGEGKTAKRIANIEAEQLKKQGIASKAEAVQTAKHERKKSELMQSRAKALAGKSGSAVSSGDVQKAISDIDQQGEYNALAALYSGYSAANSKEYEASLRKTQGKIAQRQAYIKAGSTILDSAGGGGSF